MTQNEQKNLLKIIFSIAEYDYKDSKLATVSFLDSGLYYDLLPMLDKKEDILKVISDLRKGAFICPF